jgi:chromosome partitioning protein
VIRIANSHDLHKIVIINPKGGCGKTTLSTNLASYYALRGPPPTIIDCDPQGFCIRWLEKRPADRPTCYGIEGYLPDGTGSDDIFEIPRDSNVAIIDLPAAIQPKDLHAYTYMADSILLPIVPSAIDVFSASRFVAELMLDMQLDRREQKLAIVANRVRSRTRSFEMLKRFLTSLKIPMIATLRDSQVYVHAAEKGLGIAEMPAHLVRHDLPGLTAIVQWLDRPRAGKREASEVRTAAGVEEIEGERAF